MRWMCEGTFMRRWALRRCVVLATALACVVAPFVGTSHAKSWDRPVAFCSVGRASVSNPSPRRFSSVDPMTGYQIGIYIPYRVSRHGRIDVGLLFEKRGAVAHFTSAAWGSDPIPFTVEREVALRYLTIPFRARVTLGRGRLVPYVTLGPELSLLLTAKSHDTTVSAGWPSTESQDLGGLADPVSWGAQASIGVSDSIKGRPFFLELGLSRGLEGVGGNDHMIGRLPSGLGEAQTSLLVVAAGVQL
jgi:hypothetical protein